MTRKGITPKIAQKIRANNGLEETKLQRLRVKKGLSQTALSELSGVSKRAIQTYEQGERDVDGAKLHTLCNLSAALGCKIEDILESKELIAKYRATK